MSLGRERRGTSPRTTPPRCPSSSDALVDPPAAGRPCPRKEESDVAGGEDEGPRRRRAARPRHLRDERPALRRAHVAKHARGDVVDERGGERRGHRGGALGSVRAFVPKIGERFRSAVTPRFGGIGGHVGAPVRRAEDVAGSRPRRALGTRSRGARSPESRPRRRVRTLGGVRIRRFFVRLLPRALAAASARDAPGLTTSATVRTAPPSRARRYPRTPRGCSRPTRRRKNRRRCSTPRSYPGTSPPRRTRSRNTRRAARRGRRSSLNASSVASNASPKTPPSDDGGGRAPVRAVLLLEHLDDRLQGLPRRARDEDGDEAPVRRVQNLAQRAPTTDVGGAAPTSDDPLVRARSRTFRRRSSPPRRRW